MIKKRNRLYSWLTNRYQMIIRNEADFAEKTTISFNYAYILSFLGTTIVVIFIFSLLLAKTVLGQWFDPSQIEKKLRSEVQKLFYKVETLEKEAQRKDLYIKSFQTILNGGEKFKGDSLLAKEKDAIKVENLEKIAPIDSQIRKEFEEEFENRKAVEKNAHTQGLSDMLFFPPVNGYNVSSHFNVQKEQYGIDVIAKENSPIQSVADGTVIMANWTHDNGYVITIQHNNNIVSIYKHNSLLLKKVGNFVKAGDVIGIIGNSGELSTSPHLYFELWNQGTPINPEHFISFK